MREEETTERTETTRRTRANAWSDVLARGFIASSDQLLSAGTRVLGRLARTRVPGPIARPLLRAWTALARVDVSRTPEGAWAGFRSFDEAFTRRVQDPVATGASLDAATSPCDGTLRAFGRVSSAGEGEGAGEPIPSKWGRASLVRLLDGDEALAARFDGGVWGNVYLAPRDYHRVHAPLSGAVRLARHVPGRLLPLWDSVLASEPALFHVNERVVLCGEGEAGPWLLVLVAAFGVGGIEVPGTGPRRRGEEVAVFHMGSTVIFVLPPKFEFVDGLTLGSVRCGTALAEPSRR